ncbi:SDR family oxidoreductase [Streptomyces sp. NPDC016459]|uniref:SDR family oxidoreductase n=1 Tax=Streptomyces sp. NPDC016459 TaxID=3157190 RepID=UPI0033C6E3DD
MPYTRSTVLLTGATGVIGSRLITALTDRHHVIALIHRRQSEGTHTCVTGDLTADRLGLDTGQYRELAHNTDVIVHCGGQTDFAQHTLDTFDEVNADGTRRIMELARAAGAPVLLLSSMAAVMEVEGDDLTARSLRAYAQSKRRAEEAAASTHPVAIVRCPTLFAPRNSIDTPAHQFPHIWFRALLRGQGRNLPVSPDHWCDVIPLETLVAYLSALTDALLNGEDDATGLHWAMAGPARLTAGELARVCTEFLAEVGLPAGDPILADPTSTRTRFTGMGRLAQLSLQAPQQPPYPSDLDRYLPHPLTLAVILDALHHNLRLTAAAQPIPAATASGR